MKEEAAGQDEAAAAALAMAVGMEQVQTQQSDDGERRGDSGGAMTAARAQLMQALAMLAQVEALAAAASAAATSSHDAASPQRAPLFPTPSAPPGFLHVDVPSDAASGARNSGAGQGWALTWAQSPVGFSAGSTVRRTSQDTTRAPSSTRQSVPLSPAAGGTSCGHAGSGSCDVPGQVQPASMALLRQLSRSASSTARRPSHTTAGSRG